MRLVTIRTAASAACAVALTSLLPVAFARHHDDHNTAVAGTSPEQKIPGLTRSALAARATGLLPRAVVSTDFFNRESKSDKSHTTYYDNTEATSPTLKGGVSFTFNADGTVWMVSCDATTPHPQTSPILHFCTDLDYIGANPPAIRTWTDTNFATPVNGFSLQQQRSRATWIISTNNFGGGLTFSVDVQPGL